MVEAYRGENGQSEPVHQPDMVDLYQLAGDSFFVTGSRFDKRERNGGTVHTAHVTLAHATETVDPYGTLKSTSQRAEGPSLVAAYHQAVDTATRELFPDMKGFVVMEEDTVSGDKETGFNASVNVVTEGYSFPVTVTEAQNPEQAQLMAVDTGYQLLCRNAQE